MNWKPVLYWLAIGLMLLISSCNQEEIQPISFIEIPKGFPNLAFPTDNDFSNDRFLLGRKLFYDPILSKDSTISCASCHRPEFAFTDQRAVSVGIMSRIGSRNAPSLANVAYHPYLLREGGVPSLEMQVAVPIQEHNEFDENILVISDKLNNSPIYREMSMTAYNRFPDAFVITRSIATFERALLSGNAPYDQFVNGISNALSNSAKNGLKLFTSQALKCSQCHSGFNFTNYTFQNNGLYENDPDEGRKRLTGKEEDRSLYKVPSLRNVAVTYPYMHDGSIESLEAIIDHYAKGGNPNKHKSTLISGFKISNQEKIDLVNFLKALTDTQFLKNNKFKYQ